MLLCYTYFVGVVWGFIFLDVYLVTPLKKISFLPNIQQMLPNINQDKFQSVKVKHTK